MPFGQGADLIDLLEDRTHLEREAAALKGRLSQVNQRIRELAKGPMALAFDREGQPSGTVKFILDNHMIKAVVSKRVEWDSDLLKDIASTVSPALTANLFKVVYSVPEANFKAVLDPTLRARLTLARTVKYDEAKITLAEDDT